MANISVTYTFSNGTTADATQVNQDFTDIISGTSDGTKDFSISALTAAGNVSFTGSSITLGNATGDDLTITASLASTINIKTTNSYNIGSSTLGLASIYLGANSQTVRVLGSSSMSATWTLTLPVDAGTANYALTTSGAGVTSWTAWSTSAWAATTTALGTVFLPNDMIRCDTSNGYGSGATKILRWTNRTDTGGAGITAADDATNSTVFTVNQAGIYAVSFTFCPSGAAVFGISLNADGEITTNVQSVTANLVYAMDTIPTADEVGSCAFTARMAATDTVRAHTDGTAQSGSVPARARFVITQCFRTA